MSTPKKLQQAIFPDCPREDQLVDMKTGKITSSWNLFFQQLVLSLQTYYSQEGLKAPPQSADNIALIKNTAQCVGTITYDTTNNVFKGTYLTSYTPDPRTGGVTTATKIFQLV